MLTIVVPDKEFYNDSTEEFVTIKGCTIQLEHSLVSLSKWESKWCKPFLSKIEKTRTESVDYIRCMTITQNVRSEVYQILTSDNLDSVDSYIGAAMTATSLPKDNKPATNRIITAELIYYWMIALNIPFECQKWHLNRLLTLIGVCNIENQPTKSMTQGEIISRNAALNDAHRKAANSKG